MDYDDFMQFSADEESIADHAEATLRSQFSHRSADSRSYGVMAPPLPLPAAPAAPPRRPRNTASKRSMDDGSAADTSRRKKRSGGDGGESHSEHSAFAPPPIRTKGAFAPPAAASDSHARISHALTTLGLAPEHHDALRAAMARPVPADDAADAADSASFRRQHAVSTAQMFGAAACAICEEHTSFAHDLALRQANTRRSAADRTLSTQQRQKERLLRMIQARSNLAEGDQKLHRVLYEVEFALRGRIADERIFRLLIVLRRDLIEKRMEQFEIEYVPWTLEMLRKHFDPDADHFDQPVRSAMREYKMISRLFKDACDSCMAGGTVDFRGFQAVERMAKLTRSYREEIGKLLDESAPNFSEALRTLTEAISRTTRDDGTFRLLIDTETASGRVAAGGDNRTTAGQEATHEPNSAYALHYISAE